MLLGTYHQERIRNVIKGMQENLRILNIYVVKSLSHVQLFVTPWTVAYQASLSMGFSRPEYSSGLPFPSPGDLPNAEIEPRSPALQADSLLSEPTDEN